ncbi:MAG TPA: SMP-30/gluconolactonase/LRE family protein [Bryobacteraceae bacterium]|nr:SMP-30/gluconolactonase/LRE family protein [Bryobacteraceae bacterium]
MKALLTVSAAVLLTACSNGPAPVSASRSTGVGRIVRLDPAFSSIVPEQAQIEKVAGGFQFAEGPLWRADGHLWFSDVVGNMVRSVTPGGVVQQLIKNGGGENNAPAGSFVGPNGMVVNAEGDVLLCQHTNRRIVKVSKDLQTAVYLDKFDGERFNSPNDLVYRPDGSLYFTDPPYGLTKQDDDPAKEIKFNGVLCYSGGKLRAVIKDLPRPNGIAFSPDGKILYVSNSEPRKYWMRYDVVADGSVSNGRVFADVSAEKGEGLPDGMKVDSQGNVYASGPGGLWVFSPEGKHIGTIQTPETPANCGWGEDGKTLYITARTGVYRIKLAVAGQTPLYPETRSPL